jgi:hypothetical protein
MKVRAKRLVTKIWYTRPTDLPPSPKQIGRMAAMHCTHGPCKMCQPDPEKVKARLLSHLLSQDLEW